MRTLVVLLFIVIISPVFSQNLRKLPGRWGTCGLHEVSAKDTLVLYRDFDSACQLNACSFTNWLFDNSGFKFNLSFGCPNDALGTKAFNWTSWDFGLNQKETTFWIMDDHQKCYYFKIIELTDKKLKIKRLNGE